MSEELENIIKSLPIKTPSSELDSRIENIIAQGCQEETNESDSNTATSQWSKAIMYGIAAALFISIGIAEIYKRSKAVVPEISQEEKPVKSTDDGKAVDTYTVSTQKSSDKLYKGEIIELENGSLVRPVIRRVIIRKTYFDKEKNVEVEIEEPRNEIYYIPLKSE